MPTDGSIKKTGIPCTVGHWCDQMTALVIPFNPGDIVLYVLTIAFAFYGVYSFVKTMRPKSLIPDIKRWLAARTQTDDQYD